MKKVLGFLWSKFSHNWWLKVLAIVISTVMWFMITNNENPVGDMTFYGVHVNIISRRWKRPTTSCRVKPSMWL